MRNSYFTVCCCGVSDTPASYTTVVIVVSAGEGNGDTWTHCDGLIGRIETGC